MEVVANVSDPMQAKQIGLPAVTAELDDGFTGTTGARRGRANRRSPFVAGTQGAARCSDVMRARLIQLSLSGLRVPAIAVELGRSQTTVCCRLHRFNCSGLQELMRGAAGCRFLARLLM
ncbi:helix-turn-helix domain-containing protein [Streptomyces sp. NPDC001107]